MSRFLKEFARETRGTSLIEFALLGFLLFSLTGGAIDFSLAFYQWNSVSKAVQLGARLAAVSDPVCKGVSSEDGMQNGADPGDLFPPTYEYVYTGSSDSCSSGDPDPNDDAVNDILFGRGSLSCKIQDPGQSYPGMCDISFVNIEKQNIIITYTGTSLGYSSRPLGPVPTITVEVTGLNFNFMLLNGFGLGPIAMPRMHTTVTGEDLKSGV